MQKILEELLTIDTLVVLILGASMLIVMPELQGNIISGLIGFLGAKGLEAKREQL